jgi:hypothetical protein
MALEVVPNRRGLKASSFTHSNLSEFPSPEKGVDASPRDTEEGRDIADCEQSF